MGAVNPPSTKREANSFRGRLTMGEQLLRGVRRKKEYYKRSPSRPLVLTPPPKTVYECFGGVEGRRGPGPVRCTSPATRSPQRGPQWRRTTGRPTPRPGPVLRILFRGFWGVLVTVRKGGWLVAGWFVELFQPSNHRLMEVSSGFGTGSRLDAGLEYRFPAPQLSLPIPPPLRGGKT